MLIEKEIIGPGEYWYVDEATGLPRQLKVTPDLTRYWCDQGSKMLSAGLTIPVPYEHDFNAHPMTPKEKLLNNAGEVKQYRLRGDKLFGVVDVQDPDVRHKIGRSIRWTSPWISSFTDGQGNKWNNVISHLALTTRPRITKQEPFGSIAAALSMAVPVNAKVSDAIDARGYCLSRAGRLARLKADKRLVARYPLAFSMWAGGVRLAEDDMPPRKKPPPKGEKDVGAPDKPTESLYEDDDNPSPSGPDKGKPGAGAGAKDDGGGTEDMDVTTDPPGGDGMSGLMNPLGDANGDVAMEELLCDLLQALGVPMPDASNEAEFKRHLYEAVMSKIKELTSKGMGAAEDKMTPDQNKPTTQQPNASQANPLIQEQQPMYMSLEQINALPEVVRGVALAMYQENVKLRAVTDSLRDAKLKEAQVARAARVNLLSRVSPRLKADLEAMQAKPGMALSLGDKGDIVDPMHETLAMLEKGLADVPRLLTTPASEITLAAHPTDADTLTAEQENELADDMARRMGCPPEKRAS